MPDAASSPDLLPLLSRGKHRSPRKGACFMELASYLAGERWSDHPACTHPLLAALARHVNDRTSDAARPHLAPLIPAVIGLTGDDPVVDLRLSVLCAARALPVVAEERQRVLAVALLSGERLLLAGGARRAGGPGPGGTGAADLVAVGRAALRQAPGAAAWARRFSSGDRTSASAHRRHAAPHVVGYAVQGIASACVPDPDRLLRELLAAAVDDVAAVTRAVRAPAPDRSGWEAACALTGAAPAR